MIKPVRPISGKRIPKGWHTALWDWVASMDIRGDMKTVFVKATDQGKMISAKPISDVQSANASGGGDSGGYDGPFRVIKKNENTLTLLGFNKDNEKSWGNLMDIGAYSNLDYTGLFEVPETDIEIDLDSQTGAGGWVYLDIYVETTGTEIGQIVSNYQCDVMYAKDFPAQTAEHYYHRLAYVKINVIVDQDGRHVSIEDVIQWQYGGIVLPGRIF